MRAFATAALLALAASAGATVFEPREFTSAEHEQTYRKLIDELRCLVCQNQNIADSDADLASDLRREVFEQLEAGRSEEEILAFMTERYGDFVLYRPPLDLATIALWGGPFALVAVGGGLLAMRLRRSHGAGVHEADPALDDTARRRLAALTGQDEAG